ncbi:hypothetical protein ES708_22991 [subsurface metagenome]
MSLIVSGVNSISVSLYLNFKYIVHHFLPPRALLVAGCHLPAFSQGSPNRRGKGGNLSCQAEKENTCNTLISPGRARLHLAIDKMVDAKSVSPTVKLFYLHFQLLLVSPPAPTVFPAGPYYFGDTTSLVYWPPVTIVKWKIGRSTRLSIRGQCFIPAGTKIRQLSGSR